MFALAMALGCPIMTVGMYVAASYGLGNWRFSIDDMAFTLVLSTIISVVSSTCIVIGALRLDSRVERVVAIVVMQVVVALCTGWLFYSWCSYLAAA